MILTVGLFYIFKLYKLYLMFSPRSLVMFRKLWSMILSIHVSKHLIVFLLSNMETQKGLKPCPSKMEHKHSKFLLKIVFPI